MIEVSKEDLITLIGGALIGGMSGHVVVVNGEELSLSDKWNDHFQAIMDKYAYLFDSSSDGFLND